MEDENQGGLSEESRRRVEQILGEPIPEGQLARRSAEVMEGNKKFPSIRTIILVIIIILIFIAGLIYGYFYLLDKTKSLIRF